MCRSRRELSNAYLLAKIGVDTAENEPLEVWGENSIQYSLHSLLASPTSLPTSSPTTAHCALHAARQEIERGICAIRRSQCQRCTTGSTGCVTSVDFSQNSPFSGMEAGERRQREATLFVNGNLLGAVKTTAEHRNALITHVPCFSLTRSWSESASNDTDVGTALRKLVSFQTRIS